MNGGVNHAPKNKPANQKAPHAAGSTLDDPESQMDPAQVKFLSKCDPQNSDKLWLKRWTRREKYLMIFCALLFLLCVVFVVVAVTRDLQLKVHKRRNKTAEICLTKACVSTAAQLMAGMDVTADPCDDFFQYACGQWNKKHTIPEDKPTYNTFDKLHDELQVIMKDLLEAPNTERDSDAIRKAKVLYKSCTNISQIEEVGDSPLRELIKELGGWPMLDEKWSADTFVVEDVLAKMRARYGSSALLLCKVGADDKDSSVNIIQLDQVELGMPSREYYLLKDHANDMQAYSRYMKDIVKLLGGDGQEVDRQLDEILAFEIKIANLTLPSEETQDTGANYNRVILKDIQKILPSFDILRFLRGCVLHNITEEEPIVLFSTKYIQNVVKLIRETNPRIVANYMMWRLVMEMVPELGDAYQQAQAQYKTIIQGVKRDAARWKKCVAFVNVKMGMAVGAMFIRDNFKKESKDTAVEMIRDIREAFNELLEENIWMDDKTRSVAKEKANAMTERIGYPDFITNPAQLDAKYEMLKFQEDTYFENTLNLLYFASKKMVDQLREPVRHDVWEVDTVMVNAFYNPNTNNILFPAGILQPVFYSSSFPKSLNYGGIGVVIGHEITHGFDDKGRQYDKHGNIKQWWDNRTIEAFRERAKCIVDQYSQYKLEQINEYMNGKMTQGENIADNGGLKQAYRAYSKWVERNGEEPALPGIGLSHNQLFFLNYAQIWCGKMRDEEAWRKIRTSYHSLGPLRVFGPLSNSHEFSAAYNCPLGSRMNPRHKCSVW